MKLQDIPVPLVCQPGITDAAVLWDTFGKRYLLPPGPLSEHIIILDLGANLGYTAVDLAVRYPRIRIFTVEQDADNIALSRWNLQFFSQCCTVIQAVVWSYDGKFVIAATLPGPSMCFRQSRVKKLNGRHSY